MTASPQSELQVILRSPHSKQAEFVHSEKKRLIARAGRRSGKTTGAATRAEKRFLEGARVLYAAPTHDQLDTFWFEVKQALAPLIDAGVLYCNETRHVIEFPGTANRIRAKTAWNADTLRGDYADELFLDEWQLMNEDAWELVGAPMLLDNNGNAVFLYTPPSMRTRSVSKAWDKLHAAKMFARAREDPRWEAIHFTSYDNPHISREALDEVSQDMSALAYRMEILAEDVDEAPAALWKRTMFAGDQRRPAPDLRRVVVAIDPTGSRSGDEAGIVVAGVDADGCGYVLADESGSGMSPEEWADRAVQAYHQHRADRIVGEANFGGDMVESTLRVVDPGVAYKAVHASRGKAVRAEPVAALYERGMVSHVEEFPELEDQLCMWTPDSGWSPDRLDALVWCITDLMLQPERKRAGIAPPELVEIRD